MNDKEVIRLLMEKEREITNKIHNAIEEILRGKGNAAEELNACVGGIEYTVSEILRIYNR